MIALLGLKKITLDYNYSIIETLNGIKNINILIIKYSKIKELDHYTFSGKQPVIIVVEKKDSLNHHLKVYRKGYDYYISGDEYKLIVKELVNKIVLKYNLFNNIIIKEDINEVIIDEEIIKLSSKEMEVYNYLYNNRDNLCKREDILVNVLGYHQDSDSRIVDVYIKYLRTKLKEEGNKIKTIRGKGYIYIS